MTGEIEVAVDLQPGVSRQWDVELDATRFRRGSHKNKYGKDYPPCEVKMLDRDRSAPRPQDDRRRRGCRQW